MLTDHCSLENQTRRLRTSHTAVGVAVACIIGWLAADAQDQAARPSVASRIDRTVLPPTAPEFKGKIGTNYKESTPDFSPALSVTAPEGTPYILFVVLDDVGDLGGDWICWRTETRGTFLTTLIV